MPYPPYHLLVTRRSVAMLQPGTKVLDREEAMKLIAEMQDLERRMRDLRRAIEGLLGKPHR